MSAVQVNTEDVILIIFDTFLWKCISGTHFRYIILPKNNVLKKYKQGLEAINLLLKILEGNTENISPEDTALVREMWGVDSLDALSKEELIMHSLKTLSMGGDGSSLILEESCVEFVNMYGCEPVEYFAVNGEQFIMGEATGGLIKDALAQYRPMVELAMNSCKYVSPFYEMPFTCVIETDATGNVVKTEEIVVPYWWESLVEVSQFNSSTYSSSVIELTNQAEGGEIKIYDTTYNCYPLNTNSGALICTRASMRIDGVDSEGVLIDPTSEQINDLYKDITLSRFE